jgi:hypothetical protein
MSLDGFDEWALAFETQESDRAASIAAREATAAELAATVEAVTVPPLADAVTVRRGSLSERFAAWYTLPKRASEVFLDPGRDVPFDTGTLRALRPT